MKNLMIILALLATTAIGGTVYAATDGPMEGFRTPVPEEDASDAPDGWAERDGGKRFDRLAEILDLTPEQTGEITKIREDEKRKMAPLRKELEKKREEMKTLVEAATFDEGAVRALAESQAAARTEMIVSRARMQNRINAVLTPEQRLQAEKLRPAFREGREKGFGKSAPSR